MKQSIVVILDPRGNISSGGEDVIQRHNLYANELTNHSKIYKLIILTSSSEKKLTKNKLQKELSESKKKGSKKNKKKETLNKVKK